MKYLVGFLLLIALLFPVAESFQIGKIGDYLKEGYKEIKSKFGDRLWFRNTEGGE